ncbi:MAG: hypothetical protein EOM37_03970 [Proteobacteria bacterium]|jgi:hypothetical protein|nr:hypothetical protein [Alphaproteobacteria bacterium]NCC03192.1 hypothetical protein [Pseudomonadota bacterium]
MKKKILFLAILLFGGWVALGWDNNPFAHAPIGYLMQEPVQGPADIAPFIFQDYAFSPHSYRITPKASYWIQARVLHKRRYYSDKYKGSLVPYDLGLGWKNMSDPVLLSDHYVFDHKSDTVGGRFLWTSWKTGKDGKPIVPPADKGDPMAQLSNNHLIPANVKVFNQLAHVKAGDMVALRGYLVEIEDPTNPYWKWTTSLTRNDTSTHWGGNNTSCETIFVTEVMRITSTTPLTFVDEKEGFRLF